MSRVHMDTLGNASTCLLCGMTPQESDRSGEIWCFQEKVEERGTNPNHPWCTPDHPLITIAEVHST